RSKHDWSSDVCSSDLSTDAYYFALLPVADQIGLTFGIPSLATTYAMIIGNIVRTFVSPFSPALWLALGLAGLEMGKHICYSFFRSEERRVGNVYRGVT